MPYKRIFFVSVILIITAVGFWTGSRYPALDEKAIMGAETELSALGFSILLEVPPDLPLITKIAYNAINWGYTNRQGMSFGLFFAALVMTLLPLLRTRKYRNPFANTLLGMFMGTPLGVCVNCAAPIARGLYTAGASAETTLAMMISSPTFNIVVLTMLFSMFPGYIAVTKVVLTAGFVLIVIPLITRFLPVAEPVISDVDQKRTREKQPFFDQTTPDQDKGLHESWPDAIFWSLRHVSKNLWLIIKTTVPLMIIAGVLGSAFVTIIPFESLVEMIPDQGFGLTLLIMALVAMIGVFLPVPMAFDVIVTTVLWQAGLPIKYVATLLFTLGIFSVYSFFIISQSISRRIALAIVGLLVMLGVLAGSISHKLYAWDMVRQTQIIYDVLAQAHTPPQIIQMKGHQTPVPAENLVPSLQNIALTPRLILETEQLSLEKISFQAKNDPMGAETLFTKRTGTTIGIDEPYDFSVEKLVPPFTQFRGIAAGDIHNDGWTDLVLTTAHGVSLYANQGGKNFIPQEINIPALQAFYTVNVALIDLNNDAWLDLVFSTYKKGNYVIYNQEGRFVADHLHLLPNHQDAIMSAALSFGDVDRDQDLDIVFGNWSFGKMIRGYTGLPTSRNALLINDNNQYLLKDLPGPDGETLTALMTDFNNDHALDVIIGNDFAIPDIY